MTALLIWRLITYVGLLLLAAGTTGAFLPERIELRQRMVYTVGTCGLALTWIASFGLMRAAGWSMRAPWIGASILLSVLWFQLVVWVVEREDRRRPSWAIAAGLLLVAALVLMVFRPG